MMYYYSDNSPSLGAMLTGIAIFLLIIYCFIYTPNPDVNPGDVWIAVENEENPFIENDTIFIEVLDVKEGWALIKYSGGELPLTREVSSFKTLEKFRDGE